MLDDAHIAEARIEAVDGFEDERLMKRKIVGGEGWCSQDGRRRDSRCA